MNSHHSLCAIRNVYWNLASLDSLNSFSSAAQSGGNESTTTHRDALTTIEFSSGSVHLTPQLLENVPRFLSAMHDAQRRCAAMVSSGSLPSSVVGFATVQRCAWLASLNSFLVVESLLNSSENNNDVLAFSDALTKLFLNIEGQKQNGTFFLTKLKKFSICWVGEQRIISNRSRWSRWFCS